MIDASRIDGKFLAQDGTEHPGQEIVADLLDKCHKLVDEALKRYVLEVYILLIILLNQGFRQGLIALSLRPTAEKLFRLKSHLERLSVTQAWSLRETDLYDYITQVQEIDRSRVEGKFVDKYGNIPEDGQSVSDKP